MANVESQSPNHDLESPLNDADVDEHVHHSHRAPWLRAFVLGAPLQASPAIPPVQPPRCHRRCRVPPNASLANGRTVPVRLSLLKPAMLTTAAVQAPMTASCPWRR